MTATALVARLRSRGVILEPDGDVLVVRPASAVSVDEVETLRRHKPAVLALLTSGAGAARSARSRSPWPDALPGIGARRAIPFTPCLLCPRWTFASYGAAPLCLDCATSQTAPARGAYREALRRVWGLTAEAERADPAVCVAALDELARRLDDVGEPVATELRRRWARDWYGETGRCPTCGESGPLHGGE